MSVVSQAPVRVVAKGLRINPQVLDLDPQAELHALAADISRKLLETVGKGNGIWSPITQFAAPVLAAKPTSVEHKDFNAQFCGNVCAQFHLVHRHLSGKWIPGI